MPLSAWLMMIFAVLFLGGGLLWSLGKAKKSEEIKNL